MEVRRRVRINRGWVAALAVAAIPTFGWLAGYDFGGMNAWQTAMVSVAKIGAFGGMAMFAVSLLLSGRYVWLDRLFGGLDQVYVSHRFFGSLSMVLLLLHPIGLTLARPRSFGQTVDFWLGGGRFDVFLGVAALYGLIGVGIWSMATRARYETFVSVHRWLGALFLIGAVHAFMAGSILGQASWLFWYMLVLTLAAGGTYVVYSLFGDALHRPLDYEVESVSDKGQGVSEVVLKPRKRLMRFSPGQFVYVSFEDLHDSSFHPLSITSGRKDSNLRLAVRSVGDFSQAVAELKPGAPAKVKGPYGGFTFLPARRHKQLWIAGGIGVTPFLSGARSLMPLPQRGQIEMIYATNDAEPYGFDELEQIEHSNPSFNVTLYNSDEFGYVTLKALSQHYKDFDERFIYLCGPPAMTEALAEEAEQLGLSNRLVYEEFVY